ncbi:MAG: DUF4252 domain-containing protein [Bacteroidales bacterium]
MKKLFILMFAAILPIAALGQTKQVNEILDKYEKKKNVESILISPSLLQIAGTKDVDASTKDLLSKITEMRIINIKVTATENGTPVWVSLKGELETLTSGDLFTRVVKLQEGEELLEMFVTKNSQGALLFFSTTPKEYSVISIFGNIDKTVINAAMTGGIKVK